MREATHMARPDRSATIRLRDGFEITRIVKGGYQLARQYPNRTAARSDEEDIAGMEAAVAGGIRTFDCGDIYIGVEDKIGGFLARGRARGHDDEVKVLTKFVPDVADLGRVNFDFTRRVIERSLQRLGLQRLHMVQFHWWDHAIPGWMDVLEHLVRLREHGSIEQVALTNFSTQRTREILDAGFPIASTQVQYSLLDRRPGRALAELCASRGVGMLCYGTLCGSLLTDRWLGKAAPARPFREKYSRIVDHAGGWDILQSLLRALHVAATRHTVSIAAVATRYVLEQPGVSAAIVGAHSTAQVVEARSVLDFALSQAELDGIDAVLAQAQPMTGDVFELERDLQGTHGSIYVTRRSRHSESAPE